ncbi:MAG: hypothetical protein WAM71_12545 [Candidatus Korobacteraceae bacterium]
MNAIDVECPQCGAKPGQRCHTLTGKANPVSHAKRKLAAFEAETPREDKKDDSAQVAIETTSKT